MLPAAVTHKLVVDWGAGPIRLPQEPKERIEVTAFDQDLLPLVDVGYLLAQSTKF